LLLSGLSVAGNIHDLRIPENANVKIRGFFALAVEPEAGSNLLAELHECVSFVSVQCIAERGHRKSTASENY
jgi:hypothetical protein